MKYILPLFLLISVNSLASQGLSKSAPMVKFDETLVPLTKTCLDKDGKLKTTFKVDQYEELDEGKRKGTEYLGKQYLTTDLTYSELECVSGAKGSCVNYKEIQREYPLQANVKTYETTLQKQRVVKKLVKSERFEVPNCN